MQGKYVVKKQSVKEKNKGIIKMQETKDKQKWGRKNGKV